VLIDGTEKREELRSSVSGYGNKVDFVDDDHINLLDALASEYVFALYIGIHEHLVQHVHPFETHSVFGFYSLDAECNRQMGKIFCKGVRSQCVPQTCTGRSTSMPTGFQTTCMI